jgi:hypothetical protein
MRADLSPSIPPGRHDAARRRNASRKGRERGCSLYLSAEELGGAGIGPYGPAPQYKVWPGRKRTVLVQLYQPPTPTPDPEGENDA